MSISAFTVGSDYLLSGSKLLVFFPLVLQENAGPNDLVSKQTPGLCGNLIPI